MFSLLRPEDQERVNRYLNRPSQHADSRSSDNDECDT